jgi:hypothetical protein
MQPWFIALLLCLAAPTAIAAPPKTDAASSIVTDTSSGQWTLAAAGGVSVFLNSQSSALEHFYEPVARLRGMLRLDARFQLGLEITSVVTDNENYRLVGGYVRGEGRIYNGSVFDLDLVFGVGLGTGPAILSPDLVPESDIVPWGELGLHMAWQLSSGFGMHLDILGEHLGVISLVAGVEFYL